MRQAMVFDGRNLFDPVLMAEAGFEYQSVGRMGRRGRRDAPSAQAQPTLVPAA